MGRGGEQKNPENLGKSMVTAVLLRYARKEGLNYDGPSAAPTTVHSSSAVAHTDRR